MLAQKLRSVGSGMPVKDGEVVKTHSVCFYPLHYNSVLVADPTSLLAAHRVQKMPFVLHLVSLKRPDPSLKLSAGLPGNRPNLTQALPMYFVTEKVLRGRQTSVW